MALSFFSESAAPRDFRISSTESESNYTKCLLCYTIKKNFYCVDCIKAGNFMHSSLPYSDRFADKQAKLLRLKANRKHVQDRCETLLLSKSKRDCLQTDTKQCADRVRLLRLAIQQRKRNIEEKKRELNALNQYNNELKLKLPRYEKRVGVLLKHSISQQEELEQKSAVFHERQQELSEIRKERIQQLIKYIFPVYITYDNSESSEELVFVERWGSGEGTGGAAGGQGRRRLVVVAPWLPADGDFSTLDHYGSESGGGGEAGVSGEARALAALGLAAQLTTLLAWCRDKRLAHALNDTSPQSPQSPQSGARAVWRLARRVRVCVQRMGEVGEVGALLLLATEGGAGERASPPNSDDEEPEHLHWSPGPQMEEATAGPAPSLVTSAAVSLVSMWRGWTK